MEHKIGGNMKLISKSTICFLAITFVSNFVWASREVLSVRGGDVINNGGGLSEQSLLYARLHFERMSESCQKYNSCGRGTELGIRLRLLAACQKPNVEQIKFSEDLDFGVVYQTKDKGLFVINRKRLYTEADQALSVPKAFPFLARIFLDYCGFDKFDESIEIVSPMAEHASEQGEQVTIGKETLNLPKSEWIRVRSLYSDLLIETPKMLLRLSCKDESLSKCSFSETGSHNNDNVSKFKNLSLLSESMENKVIYFNIEGYFLTSAAKERFSLFVDSEDGWIKKAILQNQELLIP